MGSQRSDAIRARLQAEVFWSGRSPVARVAREFGITKQAVLLHVNRLIDDGLLSAAGERRYRRYSLPTTLEQSRTFTLRGGVTEDDVWEQLVRPIADALAMDDNHICYYGLTEMVNNAVDHSGGDELRVDVSRTPASITLRVTDDGVGIVQKIAAALRLSDPRQALLELSKGKFTTDPRRHTGEGVFFTSRAFDRFMIRSSNLLFHHSTRTEDWLIDVKDNAFRGTRITMGLLVPTGRPLERVFGNFSSGPDDHRFAKTHVPLDLATFGDESLISRSSAKRVVARVEQFDEVLLDFNGIRTIGQGFADEIFRVFANQHPSIRLIAINANEQVTAMIRRAEATRREQQGDPTP